MLLVSCFSADGAAFQATTQKTLALLPAGTPVENVRETAKWNQVVLLARPTISSGDVSALSASLQNAASSLVLSIVASVERTADATGEREVYRLSDVGVGYSTPVRDKLVVVTPDGAAQAGAKLGLFQQGMLGESMKQITGIPVLAHTSTLMLFETPALMLRDGRHQDFKVRHFVWINSATGQLTMLVWLVSDKPVGESYQVIDEPLRWVPSGMKESREIHVDGSQFSILGIPGKKAFALEDLPPGKKVRWTDAARAIAGRTSYSSDELLQLTQALSDTLAPLRTQ